MCSPASLTAIRLVITIFFTHPIRQGLRLRTVALPDGGVLLHVFLCPVPSFPATRLSDILLALASREVNMSHRFFVSLAALALVIAPAVPGTAQTPKNAPAAAEAWTHPKTPWGDPDIQGIWPGNVGVPMQRPVNL